MLPLPSNTNLLYEAGDSIDTMGRSRSRSRTAGERYIQKVGGARSSHLRLFKCQAALLGPSKMPANLNEPWNHQNMSREATQISLHETAAQVLATYLPFKPHAVNHCQLAISGSHPQPPARQPPAPSTYGRNHSISEQKNHQELRSLLKRGKRQIAQRII